jgi:hypothetical protein
VDGFGPWPSGELEDNIATTNVYFSGSEPVEIPAPTHRPMASITLGYPARGTSGQLNYRAADQEGRDPKNVSDASNVSANRSPPGPGCVDNFNMNKQFSNLTSLSETVPPEYMMMQC